jgi:tRNA threonylcarbamoyladenosine biosynthesis protein TsaB
MKILAFDTSTKFLSIAFLEDESVAAVFHEDTGMRHSMVLVPTIKKMLEELTWSLKEIELVCVGLGPGSFTGLRIAMATVKGMAAVLCNKVVGVPTMDAIAMNVPREMPAKRVAPFIDARKGKVYTCVYDRSNGKTERVTDHLLVTVDDFLNNLDEEVFFFGDAVTKYREKLESCSLAHYTEDIDWYPRADIIGRIGFRRFPAEIHDPESIEPLYLHSKECNITGRSGI